MLWEGADEYRHISNNLIRCSPTQAQEVEGRDIKPNPLSLINRGCNDQDYGNWILY